MRVTAEEYGHLITDQCGFKLECVSWVKETNQVFTCNDDFRLRRPDLTVKVQSRQESNTGRERLIRSHSSATFCFELSGNSN